MLLATNTRAPEPMESDSTDLGVSAHRRSHPKQRQERRKAKLGLKVSGVSNERIILI